MINGELIVDNFAGGGGGKSESARAVCGEETADLQNGSAAAGS